jgi:putative sterol carrier protein
MSGRGAWVGDEERASTPEAVAAQWKEIISLKGAREYPDANAALMGMLIPKEAAPADEGTADEESAELGRSVGQVFERMDEFFQADAAAGVDVVFQFNISGPGGGDWHMTIKDGTCTVEAGVHAKPTTTLKMSEDDFIKYVSGQLPAMQAYTSGKLKIEGDLMKSQLIEKLFKF